MHKFLRTMTAAAVAAAMAPAFAADATYNVDVVVVGAGAAGTAAGWAAAEKGLKVVTLEKQAMVGGTGKFSEGIFAVESSMQRNSRSSRRCRRRAWEEPRDGDRRGGQVPHGVSLRLSVRPSGA